MTAVPPKRSRGVKGLKVDIKTKKLQKPEGGMRTAAQGTVMMKKKEKDGLTVAKNENRTPTKTQIQGQIQKRRAGKTGKQQVTRAQLLETET